MQCSKKSLFLLSVATIAVFALLSQNSIAASNADSGAPSRAPKWQGLPVNTKYKGYDMSPEVDPANFTGELKSKFDRLKAIYPITYDHILNVANYGMTLDEATKDIKNPRDKIAFGNAVYAVNPAYDLNLSEKREQVRKELADPESELGQIDTLSRVRRFRDGLADRARKLPDSGPPVANYYIWDLFQPQDIANYELVLRYFAESFDRFRGPGWQNYIEAFQRYRGISWLDITDTLQAYKGEAILEHVLDNYEIDFVRKLIADVNKAYAGTKGRGGLAARELQEEDLKYLVDSGFVTVKHGYIISRITDTEYVDNFGIGAKSGRRLEKRWPAQSRNWRSWLH